MASEEDINELALTRGVASTKDAVLRDLGASALTPEDMMVRALTNAERAMTNTSIKSSGYVIPYYDASGDPAPFYRVKILTPSYENGIKYKQPRKTANHIYFPPQFRPALIGWLKENPSLRIVFITEGEKKAACACKYGFPAVALGGVDSWRSKTLTLPENTEVTKDAKSGKIKAKLPTTRVSNSVPEETLLATGFTDLLDLILQYNLTPIVVFDSDRLGTIKAGVQRAATLMAYEMRYLGVPTAKIKQIVLPDADPDAGVLSSDAKTGLDDFLVARGAPALKELIVKVYNDPRAFPRHPNPKGYVNSQLQGQISRKEVQQVASVIITELDARGLRLRDRDSGQPYYFDSSTHKLMNAVILDRRGELLHESNFGTLIYRDFGLSTNDKRILGLLASQFTGEEPVQIVRPKRIISLITEMEDPHNPDGIAIQVDDSRYVAISPYTTKPIQLLQNGTNGLLFEQDIVKPVDVDKLMDEFKRQYSKYLQNGRMENWWRSTLEASNIGRNLFDFDGTGNLTDDSARGESMRKYANLLFYISPFLLRWHGIQLPVELTLGEAGSGKSSLYSLRLRILTGRPHLRNLPTDIRDWMASLSNSGGLHVIDNVHFSDKNLRQRISDEMCRLITEEDPSIEMRKLFTNADQIRIPINCVFAMTAIQMPFTQGDLMQRAAVFEASSLGRDPDSDWVEKQLNIRGGREAWLAHQLLFLHLFLKEAADPIKGTWSDEFQTKHRLAHLEQTLTIAAKVLGMPTVSMQEADENIESALNVMKVDQGATYDKKVAPTNISSILTSTQTKGLEDADWVYAGLKAFCDKQDRHNPKFTFGVASISEFCLCEPDFEQNGILINSRKLGRYMIANKGMLLRNLGLEIAGSRMNKVIWKFSQPKQESTTT